MEHVKLLKFLIGRFAGFFFIFSFQFCLLFNSVNANDSIAVNYKFNKTFFLDIEKNKNNLICVGERGLVFRSRDEGKTWKGIQIIDKPTLTSIAFLNENTAIVVGHRGSIYKTENAGKDFVKINLPELSNDDSLLRIRLVSENHIVVVGAWGVLIESHDGGVNWKKQKIISSEFDWHLYDVVNSSLGLIAVGEAGTMVIRKPQETNWNKIESPYKGSYFGILEGESGNFFLYGMRGNVFKFSAAKKNTSDNYLWTALVSNTKSTWMSGIVLKNNSILFFGDGGLIGRKKHTFTLEKAPLKSVNEGEELSNGSIFY